MSREEPPSAGDLHGFLSARYDELEALARAATPGPWAISTEGLVSGPPKIDRLGHEYLPQLCPGGGINYDEGPDPADAAHIVRHDPAYVLADVASKRRIVALHNTHVEAYPGEEPVVTCDECGHQGDACPTLRDLAVPYADHPDYRKEWKP